MLMLAMRRYLALSSDTAVARKLGVLKKSMPAEVPAHPPGAYYSEDVGHECISTLCGHEGTTTMC